VQGEHVKKLDALSNEAMTECLRRSQTVSLMVSEEDELPILVPEYPEAKYCVAFDPLDGSSNIDVNVTIGTIFSIFRKQGKANEPATEKDILQPGKVSRLLSRTKKISIIRSYFDLTSILLRTTCLVILKILPVILI
tara:strand:- start:3428 stop:3838 length:411 start_codon:yes stop_codon:yes gene_type:complete